MSYGPNLAYIRDFDRCAACRCLLDVSFPKDFPDKLKFCCSCLGWARMLLEEGGEILLTISIVRTIKKLITLVGK